MQNHQTNDEQNVAKSMLRMKLPTLDTLLEYRNESVIRSFCFEHRYTAQEGQQIFEDLLGWLWLNAYQQIHHREMIYLFGPLLLLDKMWHTFILHTKDYEQFCLQYFEEYYHHHVEPFGHEHVLSPEELAAFLQKAFEHLGDQWVQRQFGAFYVPASTHAETEDALSSV